MDGVAIHQDRVAVVGLKLGLRGYCRVGGCIRKDRLRVCLVWAVGVRAGCMPPATSTLGPLFIFLCVLGLWEWGCVGNTVGRLALVLELWSDGMVCIVFHRVGVKVALLGLSLR